MAAAFTEAHLYLKPGREKSVLNKHPWVFSGAVDHLDGAAASGDTVTLLSSRGAFLARGAYSPHSQIRARIWTWNEDEQVSESFLQERLVHSIQRRSGIKSSNAVRLVHGESDGLPGLVVDRYGDVLILQALSAGAEAWKLAITRSLAEITGCRSIYERSDADVRQLEGLAEKTGLLWGSEPPGIVEISEHGLRYQVDVRAGHKTGFYLDQRDNRLRLREYSGSKNILNCFSYTGGFTLNALAGGASQVLSVDSSAPALETGAALAALNGFDPGLTTWLEGDVFQVLRRFRDEGRSFDLIILDPPKFAPTRLQAERAARGYKDINLLAFKLLVPGGVLFTFSCSGGVSAELFQKIVASAALDAGVDARIMGSMTQSSDHPVALNFPEGAYLKGLICSL